MSAGRGEFDTIPVSSIAVSDRMRPVNVARIEILAESIAAKGLDQPIIVRPLEGRKDQYALVIGAHRLAAIKSLGHETVKAIIRPYDAHTARLAEIDENLIRGELTPLDRAFGFAERKVAWEALHPQTRRGGDRKSKDFKTAKSNRQTLPFGFSREAAKLVGLSVRTIAEDISIATRLGRGVIRKLQSTDAGGKLNRQQLKALADLSPVDHGRIADKFAEGDPKALAKALQRGKPKLDPQEEIFRKIVGLLGRASEKTKRRVRDHLDKKGPRRGEG